MWCYLWYYFESLLNSIHWTKSLKITIFSILWLTISALWKRTLVQIILPANWKNEWHWMRIAQSRVLSADIMIFTPHDIIQKNNCTAKVLAMYPTRKCQSYPVYAFDDKLLQDFFILFHSKNNFTISRKNLAQNWRTVSLQWNFFFFFFHGFSMTQMQTEHTCHRHQARHTINTRFTVSSFYWSDWGLMVLESIIWICFNVPNLCEFTCIWSKLKNKIIFDITSRIHPVQCVILDVIYGKED